MSWRSPLAIFATILCSRQDVRRTTEPPVRHDSVLRELKNVAYPAGAEFVRFRRFFSKSLTEIRFVLAISCLNEIRIPRDRRTDVFFQATGLIAGTALPDTY